MGLLVKKAEVNGELATLRSQLKEVTAVAENWVEEDLMYREYKSFIPFVSDNTVLLKTEDGNQFTVECKMDGFILHSNAAGSIKFEKASDLTTILKAVSMGFRLGELRPC